MKFGYQGGFSNPTQHWYVFNEVINVRLSNGAPNRLTESVYDQRGAVYVRNLLPTSFYAQDQWTSARLTLQGGLRYDHLLTTYPDSRIEATHLMPKEIFYPRRSTPGISWDDVTPRVGAAYDLFGNGKTAIKFNLGKYMEAFTATNSDLDLNPLIRTTLSTSRTWTDTNKDFVPNCDLANPSKNGECADMDDKNFGKEVFTRTFDTDLIHGYGKRQYNWGMGLSVQQEVLPRVSVNVGYFRNWWGNWYVVDNRLTDPADYTPFSIRAPVDARLPGGGGQIISGLYNLVPTKVGLNDELAQHSSHFADQIENWQGVDVNVTARLRNGLTLQGGTSTGRRLSDSCDLKAKVPEQGTGVNGANVSIAGGSPVNPWCRVVEPYLTDIKGLATYTIPKVGIQVSGTWTSVPGNELAANFVANNAYIAAGPQPLGRSLTGGGGTATINLIRPGTLYADRRTNLDFRVAKIIRYGRTRTQVGVDIYNATNTDVVTGFNQAFSPTSTTWLTPTSIQPARYVKLNAQIDF
jgi:hypothetical protein